jgi:hypothetical protein
MVKIVVNKGRKVWKNGREAQEGEVIEVRDVEAKILKFRGVASDAPQEPPPKPAPPPPPLPQPRPMPPPPPLPLAPVPEPRPREAETATEPNEEEQTRRRTYRRRDLQPEE